MTDDTQPTLPIPDERAQWVLSSEPEKRRHRVWPWLIAVAAVLALAVAAWIVGEQIARAIVTKTVRDQLIARLSLPADQQIDVDLPGQVLPQLIAGRIDEITVSSPAIAFGELSGAVTVTATGIPIRGKEPAESAEATVTLDESQLRALLGTIDGFPVETVTLDAPDIAMSTEIPLFALSVPVGVSLLPTTDDGDLVLSPSKIRVAGAEISAPALLEQFGPLASSVLKDWRVCVKQYLPAGVHLDTVTVTPAAVVADLDIDGGIVHDASLQQKGECA